MNKAYEEVKRAIVSKKHKYLSEETLQFCLEALREHEERKHNGYSNYPTWLLASWIANNKKYYEKYNKILDELYNDKADEYNIIGVLTQSIEADFSKECDDCIEQIYFDSIWPSLLHHCNKDLINYREVAKSFIE